MPIPAPGSPYPLLGVLRPLDDQHAAAERPQPQTRNTSLREQLGGLRTGQQAVHGETW